MRKKPLGFLSRPTECPAPALMGRIGVIELGEYVGFETIGRTKDHALIDWSKT